MADNRPDPQRAGPSEDVRPLTEASVRDLIREEVATAVASALSQSLPPRSLAPPLGEFPCTVGN